MEFLELINYVIVFIALAGAYFNAQKKIYGFFLWVISNSYLMAYNFAIQELPQAVLFLAYLLITINGIRIWAKK